MSSDAYQALPSFPAGAPSRFDQEPAVQLIAAGPARQRRLTVAFRLILAIPHIFALLCLNLGGFVLAFAGWWAALFIGRLPGFAVSYLSGLARWNARVLAYLLLLTDVYPPFTVDDAPGYPVVIAIPEQERLNRFAVFFRGTLAIWGNIVANAVGGGAAIVALIAWLITLVTGKLPAPLHLAFTAVLRYQTRYYCYLGLLTPTYPWKLFGDEPDASAWGTPPGYDTTTPGYGPPGGYGSAQPASPSADWPLVLPQSAKILLSLFIALGLILNGASNYVSFTSRDRASRAPADFTTVSRDTTVAQFQADMASSGLAPDLDDVHADIGSLANAFTNSRSS